MKHFIWNLLSSIKNGQICKKKFIISKKKKICEILLKILWNEGFIYGYQTSCKSLKVFLKYTKNGKPAINSLIFISKPSQKIYCFYKQIGKFNSPKTLIVFSTNFGLKSIYECKKKKIGGEPLIILN